MLPPADFAPWSRLTVTSRRVRPWGMGPNIYSMGPSQDDGDHLFDDFDLWLGIEGSCDVHLLGRRLELTPGRAILIPPGIRVRQRTAAGQELVMMYVHFDCLVDGRPVLDAAPYADAKRLRLELPGLPPVALAAEIDTAGVTDKLLRIRTRPDDDLSQIRLSTTLMDVIAHLHEACLGLVGSAAEQRLDRAIGFMELNLHRPISLAETARHAHVSPATLGRLFRTRYKVSPIRYLARLRMARAREMLQARRHNVSEVARACGYRTLQYFSRAFSQEYGQSPTAFRRTLPLIP